MRVIYRVVISLRLWIWELNFPLLCESHRRRLGNGLVIELNRLVFSV